MPARSLNISSARCWTDPGPADPKLTLPGAARQRSTIACTVRADCSGRQTSRLGTIPTSMMGEKSRSTT